MIYCNVTNVMNSGELKRSFVRCRVDASEPVEPRRSLSGAEWIWTKEPFAVEMDQMRGKRKCGALTRPRI